MSTLNQKQLKMMSTMSAEQLMEIICALVEDNKQAKSLLISQYLASPDEALKKAESEYKRKLKLKRFYDYYAADDFFEELYRNIVLPLEKTVLILPEKTETFCHDLLVTFEKLCQIADTSSGSWMNYYNSIVDIWLKALSLQRDKDSNIIADKIISVLKKESYFSFSVFNDHKRDLGYDVIRSLREYFFTHDNVNAAVELSLYILDIDFVRQCLKKGKRIHPEYIINFAELLVNELCTEEAILVLNKIKEDEYVDHAGLRNKWAEVLAQALIEEGDIPRVKALCIDEFKKRCNVVFYNLYKKIDKTTEPLQLFIDMAKEKGFPFVIFFLSETGSYDKIANEIAHAETKEVSEMLSFFSGSFVRSLSSTLYKQGHGYLATLLRRILVEDNISRSQSKYYGYAASDMKKSIDYSKGITWTTQVPSTEDYFKSLFITHKRKYALWDIMETKIDGLSVTKDAISYSK
ncbi:SpnT protein [Enterobacteriaceae bacterium ESL0689]|nr:SpnT protein [Enterobacteriaceae bacterium ESL0689]